MRPRKWSGLIVIASFAVAVTVAALAQETAAPLPDASVEEETAAPAIADEFAREALTAPSPPEPVTVVPSADPDTDIVKEGDTVTGIQTDSGTTSIADAGKAAETVEKSAGILKWLHLLIVGLVPVAILGLKKVADRLPPHYLPMIAPLLGLAADAIGSLASGTTANPLVGALAGAAAVGVREVYDQWKKRNWARVTSPEVKP